MGVSRRCRALLLGWAAFATLAGHGAVATADEAPLETADGPTACRAFEAQNARELKKWEKEQPPVPYAYPHEDTILGAPWGRFASALGTTSALLLATILPHAGGQLRGQEPAALVAWPLALPFGPAFACSRKRGTFWVRKHRAHRFMLEPGIVGSNQGVGVYVRPGYRFVHHPADWVVGAGGGIGSTIEVGGNREPVRPSLGPEAVLHFGHCCEASYFVLALRYDRFFGGTNRDIVGATLGYTFF